MQRRIPFSYLVPIRNGMAYLPNFRMMIDEISENTNDEIVIVNDGSIDGTGEFLKLWSKNNPAIKIVNNKVPGLVNALNLGIEECSYEWVARFDVDDTYSRQRLNVQADAINSNTAAIFSDYAIATKNGRIISRIHSAVFSQATRISLIRNRRTPHPGVVFSKAAVQSAGGYILDDFPCEDLSLWLRLSKNDQIRTVPFELIKYRINPGSISSTQKTRMIQKKYEVLNRHPLIENEIMEFSSRFSEYVELLSSSSMAENRIASSLQEIQHCAKVYGYSLPKTNDIISDLTLINVLRFRKENARNFSETIIRNSYKKISMPIRFNT